jgi:cellulose synthase operon protein YhjU
MSTGTIKHNSSNPMSKWDGIYAWNYYFWLKFALLWYGVLNFHPLANLVFLAFIVFPIRTGGLRRIRNWVAIPIGLALFYYDTWLPGIDSIMSQGGNLIDFNHDYLIELANRFINWQMVGIAFVMFVAYLFLSEWLRLTVFTVVALTWLNLITIPGFPIPDIAAHNTPKAVANIAVDVPKNNALSVNNSLPPTNANLDAYLNAFYEAEKLRSTKFPAQLPADSQPFDILMIQICSLAWSDLYTAALDKHPLLGHFDILFTHFNTAASYSGPAAIRLLRASCGQQKHDALYRPTSSQCYLFDNLAKLGFKSEFVMDHDGEFGDFLPQLRQFGDIKAQLSTLQSKNHELIGFNDHPIFDDSETLNQWLNQLKKSDIQRSATFVNLISLHDGNRLVGQNKPVGYTFKGKQLLDSLDNFFTTIEKSGRKMMVIFVPEHGVNLKGDKLQMSGLRDLPSEAITHVPVGVKFIGMKAPFQGKPITMDAPSSYLALSDLISRVVDGKVFNAPTVDWSALIKDLPQTSIVSENEGIVVMAYQGKYYIRLKGESSWAPYPG